MKKDAIQKRKLSLGKKTVIHLSGRQSLYFAGMMPTAGCPPKETNTCPKATDGAQYSCKQNSECLPEPGSKTPLDSCACPNRTF
jgi:hypothetical protein